MEREEAPEPEAPKKPELAQCGRPPALGSPLLIHVGGWQITLAVHDVRWVGYQPSQRKPGKRERSVSAPEALSFLRSIRFFSGYARTFMTDLVDPNSGYADLRAYRDESGELRVPLSGIRRILKEAKWPTEEEWRSIFEEWRKQLR